MTALYQLCYKGQNQYWLDHEAPPASIHHFHMKSFLFLFSDHGRRLGVLRDNLYNVIHFGIGWGFSNTVAKQQQNVDDPAEDNDDRTNSRVRRFRRYVHHLFQSRASASAAVLSEFEKVLQRANQLDRRSFPHSFLHAPPPKSVSWKQRWRPLLR